MKKVFLMMVAVLLITACATSEERAARQAEYQKMMKASVGNQKYRINIDQMTPKRGLSRTVSGHWLKVDTNMVDCSLPYVGRDDIPHMKTHGEARMDAHLEFKAESRNYVLRVQPKKETADITFEVDYRGSEYKFHISLDNTGRAKVHVIPGDRDDIDYEGSVTPM